MRTAKITLALVFLMLLQAPATATAASQEQRLDAIARMGELNGIALQCRYLDQMRRIKQVLIRHLPKERALGEWFEKTTSDSFMDFMQKREECPGLIEFEQDLDQASQRIAEVFGS